VYATLTPPDQLPAGRVGKGLVVIVRGWIW